MRILSAKEQAREIGRHPTYISAMRAAGFPHLVTSPAELLQWLKLHPNFRKKNAREKKGKKGKERESL